MENNKNNTNEIEARYELLSNKLNNKLFIFLLREYYSYSINPFSCLKYLSQIIHSRITDNLKHKCSVFLFYILQHLSVSETIEGNIVPIIGDMLENILTKKADFPIVLQYASFFVRINKVSRAITILQFFSTSDNKFINSGEILFYKTVIEYMIEKQTDRVIFVKGLDKSVKLIKKDKYYYYCWIIDFCIYSKFFVELKNTLMINEYISIFLNDFPKKKNLCNLQCNTEDESLSRLTELAKTLKDNCFNFGLCEQFKELVEVYYNENFMENESIKFIEKIININETFFIYYLNFLTTYYLFQPFENDIIMLISEAFNELDALLNLEKKIKILKNEQNFENFKKMILKFYKNVIFGLLKKKIGKNIRKWIKSKKIEEGNDKIEKVIYIINLTKKIITGQELIEITPEIKQKFVSNDFLLYISKLQFK